LLTCLFAASGISLRDLVRAGATDEELLTAMTAAWRQRDDRYSELRAELRHHDGSRRRLEMYQIGG
jgi:cyclic pyranopterin phosphate synthase